jgi:hypothetical protein
MTDSQSASLSWCQAASDQFFFLIEIFFRHLLGCYCVAPSLTRGRVSNLLCNFFWALTEQSLLGRSPAELTAIFYCLIWDSPNLEGQIPVFISPRNRVAQLYPRVLGSFFVASYGSQDYCGVILTLHHTGSILWRSDNFVKIRCDIQWVLGNDDWASNYTTSRCSAITLYTTADARQYLQQSRLQQWKNWGTVFSGCPCREVISGKNC